MHRSLNISLSIDTQIPFGYNGISHNYHFTNIIMHKATAEKGYISIKFHNKNVLHEFQIVCITIQHVEEFIN